jgi:hypothetical protein
MIIVSRGIGNISLKANTNTNTWNILRKVWLGAGRFDYDVNENKLRIIRWLSGSDKL